MLTAATFVVNAQSPTLGMSLATTIVFWRPFESGSSDFRTALPVCV